MRNKTQRWSSITKQHSKQFLLVQNRDDATDQENREISDNETLKKHCKRHLSLFHQLEFRNSNWNNVLFQETKTLFQETKIWFYETKILFQETKILFQKTKVLFQETKILFQEIKFLFQKTKVFFIQTQWVASSKER